MKEDIMQSINDSILMLRPLVVNRFLKPVKEIERGELSIMQIHMMHMLFHKESISMSVLSEKLCISKPNLTPMADGLLKLGYIERKHDDNDRRIVNLHITKKGVEYIKDFQNRQKDMMLSKLSSIDEEQLKRINRAILEIYDVLKSI